MHTIRYFLILLFFAQSALAPAFSQQDGIKLEKHYQKHKEHKSHKTCGELYDLEEDEEVESSRDLAILPVFNFDIHRFNFNHELARASFDIISYPSIISEKKPLYLRLRNFRI